MNMRPLQKGLTLVELAVVILIVSILVAATVPLMQGRLNAAKWSEGKAIMGMIAKALRAHVASEGKKFSATPTVRQLGFPDGGIAGAYFKGEESGNGNFTWVIHKHDPIEYTITATAPKGVRYPGWVVLDQTGTFIEGTGAVELKR